MRDKSSQYFPLIEKYHSSGQTAKVFYARNAISPYTLGYWQKRYRDINNPKAPAEKKGFASLSLIETQNTSGISIQYSDGTRLFFEGVFAPSVVKQFIPAFNK